MDFSFFEATLLRLWRRKSTIAATRIAAMLAIETPMPILAPSERRFSGLGVKADGVVGRVAVVRGRVPLDEAVEAVGAVETKACELTLPTGVPEGGTAEREMVDPTTYSVLVKPQSFNSKKVANEDIAA